MITEKTLIAIFYIAIVVIATSEIVRDMIKSYNKYDKTVAKRLKLGIISIIVVSLSSFFTYIGLVTISKYF